jgi:hypothetical protein
MILTNSTPTDTDQTQFATDSWLYEANRPDPAAQSTEPKLPFWKTKQGKPAMIILGATLVFLLILIAAYYLKPRPEAIVEEEIDEATVAALDLGPLGEKVKLLRQQLKAADPTKEQDPFPPVNLELRLDEAERL